MTPPPSRKSTSPRKAYYVEEARHGTTYLLVWANTAKEAAEKVRRRVGAGDDVEVCDFEDHPGGVSSVRRAPEEDR